MKLTHVIAIIMACLILSPIVAGIVTRTHGAGLTRIEGESLSAQMLREEQAQTHAMERIAKALERIADKR